MTLESQLLILTCVSCSKLVNYSKALKCWKTLLQTWAWSRQAWSFLFALHRATLSLVFSRRSRTFRTTNSTFNTAFKTLNRLVWRKGSHDQQEVTAHSQYPTAEAEGLFSPAPAVCWCFAGGARSCAAYILRTGGGLWTRAAPLAEAPYWAARPLWWTPRRPAAASHLWARSSHLGYFFLAFLRS